MKINDEISNHRPRVLVLTSTFPRWGNDPEPAFIFELSRRLFPECHIGVLFPNTTGNRKQENIKDKSLISCEMHRGNRRCYIFS